MARPKSETTDKMLSRRVLVNVKRDMTTITPRVVWQHEIPLLEAVFGEGQVNVVEPETLDEGYTAKVSPSMLIHNRVQDQIQRPSESLALGFVFIGLPALEYERLASAYGKHNDRDVLVVEMVYGRMQNGTFARVLGSPALEDLPENQLREMLVGYGVLPQVAFDSTKDEKAQAVEARRSLYTKPHAELVKMAEQSGVEIG